MTWFALILAIVLLVLLERSWAPRALKALRFKGKSDRAMTEPGELVTWSGTVENHSRLPIPFVRLQEHFPSQAKVAGEEKWIREHCQRGVQQWYAEEKMSLKPRQSCTRRLQFAFKARGRYEIGSYQLAAGDLLGFRETQKTGGSQSIVVIPERSRNQRAIEALGGFLGDVSVRRFILEDPILTVGFRDYTGREPMKAISWTRTAMTGSLQVKQYDHTAEQTVMVLLNVEGGSAEEIEECFRLARSVCETLERKKISYAFRTNGNLPGPVGKLFWLSDGLGSRHVNTILYALGGADHVCFYSFGYLVKQTLLHRRNNESYIVITPALTEKTGSGLKALEQAVGNAVCVLSGRAGVEKS